MTNPSAQGEESIKDILRSFHATRHRIANFIGSYMRIRVAILNQFLTEEEAQECFEELLKECDNFAEELGLQTYAGITCCNGEFQSGMSVTGGSLSPESPAHLVIQAYPKVSKRIEALIERTRKLTAPSVPGEILSVDDYRARLRMIWSSCSKFASDAGFQPK